MVRKGETFGFSSRREAINAIVHNRSREIALTYGTPFYAGEDPVLWKPYHTLENFRSTRILQTVFDSAMAAKNYPSCEQSLLTRLADLKRDDLPSMMIAAKLFYPDFNDFYQVDASLAEGKMKKAGVFRKSDFQMVPLLIASTISKESGDPEEVPHVKEVNSAAPFGIQTEIYLDAMNNFAVLPDSMFLFALLGVERLFDNVRQGNRDAICRVDGKLPRTLAEVMAQTTRYDIGILSEQIKTTERYFFSPDSTPYMPHLPTSAEQLAYFDQNKTFFNNNIFPLTRKPMINLAALLRDTFAFSRQKYQEHLRKGGGLLD